MATKRIYPHILIDALPPLRKVLDAKILFDEQPPLLLSTKRQPRPDIPWGAERRTKQFFPTRLIHIGRVAAGTGAGPDWTYEDDVREAENLFQAHLQEARTYFRLGAKEPLRIACVGGCRALRAHASLSDYDHAEAKYLLKTDSRNYAIDLARALKSLPGEKVSFEWLAVGFPAAAAASLDGDVSTPWRYLGLGRTARRLAATDLVLKDLTGAVPAIYFSRLFRWRLYEDRPTETGPLIKTFAEDKRRRRRRRSALVLLASHGGGGDEGCLDNPIVSESELERSAAAGIDAVFLDRRFGLCDVTELSDEERRAAQELDPPPEDPAPLYFL